MNQFPPSPRVSHSDRFEFFRKFAEIFVSKGAPPVSTTPAANFATSLACVVDTGGKFATGVNDTGGKFCRRYQRHRWKFDTGGNLPPVTMTPVANNGYNIRLLRP
jgi:hypothetical protein